MALERDVDTRGPTISCTDFSFATDPASFETTAATIARLGFCTVDVSVRWRFPLTTPGDVAHDPLRVAGERRDVLERLNLTVADVFAIAEEPDISGVAHDIQTARRQFDDIAVFAKAIGAPGVTVLPNLGVLITDQNAHDRAIDELRRKVDVAGRLGLSLSVEPHGGSLASTPDTTRELLHSVPGLQLTLDYSHFAAQKISSAAVDPLIRYSRVIQLRQARAGRVQCKLADGDLDLLGITTRAINDGFKGSFTIEYVARPALPSDPVDVQDETLQLLRLLRHASEQVV